MKLRGVPLLCLLAACATPAPRITGDEPIRIELIAFNDFHGHLDPPGTPTRVPGDQAGAPDALLSTGGVAWFAGAVAALRREHPVSVVVAAGDLIGGSPLTSSLLKHEPSIDALGAAGLEFTSVGNHEFDRGVVELQRLAQRAGFKYLAANVRVKATGKLLFPAWARKRVAIPGRGGIDIAFIGAVLRTTPELVGREATAGLEFLDEAESVNRAVAEIRAAGIETIVLLIHEGGFTSSTRFDDATCPDFRGPILDIVDKLDPRHRCRDQRPHASHLYLPPQWPARDQCRRRRALRHRHCTDDRSTGARCARGHRAAVARDQ